MIDNFIKVDFHIHSAASRTKLGDIKKTKDGTFENINVLLEKIDLNEINVFSFTDHNCFDYQLYKETKELILNKDFKYNNIKNILPGVEFDLSLENTKKSTHATCIFNDGDHSKLSEIDVIIKKMVKSRDFNTIRFTEDEFYLILKEIDINFILIVHQKSDFTNDEKNGSNDFSNLSKDKRWNLLNYDYYNCYEANKHRFRFSFEKNKSDKKFNANFITGSDCHVWKYYPNNKNGEKNKIEFSYLRSDSNFEAIKIAITGNGIRRIYEKLPLKKENFLPEFICKTGEESNVIEFSSGINALIGGNTSGKSLLIAKIFNENYKNDKAKAFLDKWNVDFLNEDVDKSKVVFIGQGKIRSLFENDGAGLIEEFNDYFPKIDYSIKENVIESYTKKMFEISERNSSIEDIYKILDCDIYLPNYDTITYYPQITPLPSKGTNPTKKIVSLIEKTLYNLNDVSSVVEIKHKGLINELIVNLESINKYYVLKDFDEKTSIKYYNDFIYSKNQFSEYKEKNGITSTDKEIEEYNDTVNNYLDNVNKMICLKINEIEDINEYIYDFSISPIDKIFDDLKFVTSPKVQVYTKDTIKKIILSPFKRNCINLNEITIGKICELLKNDSSDAINKLNYKQKYSALLKNELSKNYFFDSFKILLENEEVQNEKSPGYNAIYYLMAKSRIIKNKIIVFDQPEDDVAPEKIKDTLISTIQKLSITNQLIIVTHNPLLVVNLDVDNVICLETVGDNYKVYSGPLYKTKDYSILDIIAEKLDGGKFAIKERWNRYE